MINEITLQINTQQSLPALRDYWLELVETPAFNGLSLSDKENLFRIKDKRKEILQAQQEEQKQESAQKNKEWKETKEGKVISANYELYIEFIDVTTEMEVRKEIKNVREQNKWKEENREEIIMSKLKWLADNAPEMMDKVKVDVSITPEPKQQLTLSWAQLQERYLYIKKYFRFKGVEIE